MPLSLSGSISVPHDDWRDVLFTGVQVCLTTPWTAKYACNGFRLPQLSSPRNYLSYNTGVIDRRVPHFTNV